MLSSWLLLVAGLVAVSMAQMTFSDGWGNMKRSMPIFKRLVPVAELRDAEAQTATKGRLTNRGKVETTNQYLAFRELLEFGPKKKPNLLDEERF